METPYAFHFILHLEFQRHSRGPALGRMHPSYRLQTNQLDESRRGAAPAVEQ